MKEFFGILKAFWIVWIWDWVEPAWHQFMVHVGVRPCCDNPSWIEIASMPEYYEYRCENCGHVKSGSAFYR